MFNIKFGQNYFQNTAITMMSSKNYADIKRHNSVTATQFMGDTNLVVSSPKASAYFGNTWRGIRLQSGPFNTSGCPYVLGDGRDGVVPTSINEIFISNNTISGVFAPSSPWSPSDYSLSSSCQLGCVQLFTSFQRNESDAVSGTSVFPENRNFYSTGKDIVIHQNPYYDFKPNCNGRTGVGQVYFARQTGSLVLDIRRFVPIDPISGQLNDLQVTRLNDSGMPTPVTFTNQPTASLPFHGILDNLEFSLTDPDGFNLQPSDPYYIDIMEHLNGFEADGSTSINHAPARNQ